jgi:hypothetical protein
MPSGAGLFVRGAASAGWPFVACGFECREEQNGCKNYFYFLEIIF